MSEQMKRYIEQQEITDALCAAADGSTATIAAFMDLVDRLPSADVAEVVHGEWLNFVGDYVTAECSVCGECYDTSDYNDKEHFDMVKQLNKYCPNCGAKMDGEKEGAE